MAKSHFDSPSGSLEFSRVFRALGGLPCSVDRRTEQMKTGQANLDHLTGHFRGHFWGRLRGTFRGSLRGESLKG